ncbi:uncharacterized protein [Apostichopus japonicus]|uniref:uncharacterized protein n=1 Tax=Stichopus japonicus TaxID=307972 RepID=UPI003AB86968
MSLSKDGNDNSDEIWLEKNQTFNITCHALNSKPMVNLTWNSSLIEERNMTTWNSSTTENQLFNSTSTIAYIVGNSNDTLTCSARFENAGRQWNTSVFIRSYVEAKISLSITGEERGEGKEYYTEGETLSVTCQALPLRPPAKLTLTISRISPEETHEPNCTYGNESTYANCTLSIGSYNASCLAWQKGPNITTWANETFEIEGLTTPQSSVTTSAPPPAKPTTRPEDISLPVIIGVALAIAILLIFSTITFAILWKKLFGHRTMTLPTDQRAQGHIRPLPLAMISRELPPIYDQTDMINDDVAEQSIDDTVIGLNSEDVQLNFQLPGAGTMKYWVATYSSEGDKVTKIIAKSVSENARMKEILNFRALAKNATIMPRHQNIVDVLGVSLEDVPYFIYQEYIEYGTLKDFLMRNYQESSGGSSKRDTPDHEKTLHLTMFAADICEGMLFLKRQNCHHPGLAARKVLLSPSGRCKLYDFWPVDLAQERVKQILDKKLPPLAWLAPETVFLGHFMEKSDIWNFGVVLWEIYSLGEIPFGGLTCAEIESKLRNKESLDQPLTCPGGIFGHMLATWNSAIDERPTFEHLNITLSSFLYDMRESLNDEKDNSEEPNYFRLDKDSSSSDDYIEHII